MSFEARIKELGLTLPETPRPVANYVPAVQTGNLLFLSGMLATAGHAATVVGIVGKDLDVKAGRARKPRREAGSVRRRDAGVHRAPEGRRCCVGIAARCLR